MEHTDNSVNRHINTKLSLVFRGNRVITDLHEGTIEIKGKIGSLNHGWANLSDSARLEMIKSLIWTAPDMHSFNDKVEKLVSSCRFKETLD
jgi:hypothetical protein